MDVGHFNCRDYHITPHLAATDTTNCGRPSQVSGRHESFEELEQRSRSPASLKPKFPLLRLPLELRQQIYSYLLPRTFESATPTLASSRSYARSATATKEQPCGREVEACAAKPGDYNVVLEAPAKSRARPESQRVVSRTASAYVWRKGNIKLLCVCSQIHDECAQMLYGGNTFLLSVTYNAITFRFTWLHDRGLNPSRRYPFLELLPARYLRMVRRVAINIEHVDAYTGMIKFNVSSKGLTHGLRRQARKLVVALQPARDEADAATETSARQLPLPTLQRVHIRVAAANQLIDELKMTRQNREAQKVVEGVDEVLAPFADLCGVREVGVAGAVPPDLARKLEKQMESMECGSTRARDASELEDGAGPPLCVYGNDL